MSESTTTSRISFLIASIVIAILGAGNIGAAEKESKRDTEPGRKVVEIRKEIDAGSQEAIDKLVAANESAEARLKESAGYAVFRATKAGLLLTGAGGAGVAVNRETGERTYMRMGAGGLGLGAGVQSYRLVILFETADKLADFVDGGWDTATSAQAAAGKAGLNATSSFVDGIAVYHLTDKGLMAQADLTGTRFWASERLNKP